jgi:hypothetical protein
MAAPCHRDAGDDVATTGCDADRKFSPAAILFPQKSITSNKVTKN